MTPSRLVRRKARIEENLIHLLAQGQATAAGVARITEAIMPLGGLTPAMRDLGRAAASHSSHQFRALMNWARRQPWHALMPEPYDVPVPFPEGVRDVPVLLPHEVFAAVAADDLLSDFLFGSGEELSSWWRETRARNPEWVRDHPACRAQEADWAKVPFAVHGDECPVHGGQPLLVVSYSACAVQHLRNTLDSRMIFCAVKGAVPTVAFDALMAVLRWSFEALASGHYPASNHEGREFPSGSKRARLASTLLSVRNLVGAFSEFRGDLAFLRKALRLQRSYLNDQCCHLCPVSKKETDGHVFTDFRGDAEWTRLLTTNAEFRATYNRREEPEIVHFPGFDVWRVALDWMHIQHLGVWQHLIASVMQELATFSTCWPGRTRGERLVGSYTAYRACKSPPGARRACAPASRC